MSDNKDQETIKITPPTELPDMDSTVRLDIGGNRNVVSTSAPYEITADDFDTTIDGLLNMDELLTEEKSADSGPEETTVSFSAEEIDFDDLNAGINALSEELSEYHAKAEPSDKPLDLDDSEEVFDIDQPAAPDSGDHENDLPVSSVDLFDGLSLIADEGEEEKAPETEVLPDISEDIEIAEEEVDAAAPPVIELTEKMLDGTEQSPPPELNDPEDSNIESHGNSTPESAIETPELTTTEIDILAGATAAIRELNEKEHEPGTEHPVTPPALQPSATEPVKEQKGGSNALPTILGMLGIAAGGFGAWMAFDAGNRVADMEAKLQNLKSSKAAAANKKSIADIHQRLTKIERRLTGTPTVEAAAPLGTTTPATGTAAAKKAAVAREEAAKPAVKAITPQTSVTKTGATDDWVVNLSSHSKESQAIKEQSRLQKLGINTEVHAASIKNKTWYRVQVTGFASKSEAKARLRSIQQRSGIKGAWIGKR